jgi:hypothetical protein
MVEVDPSVMRVPPASTNFTSSASPAMPMPPRMSSLESSTPRFGVSFVFLYGMGSGPVFGIPFTWETELPPMLGKIITSYLARRSPSRSF